MKIDVHAHIMAPDFASDEREILKAAESYGIDRIYVSALDGSVFYPNAEQVTSYNAAMYDFMRRYPKLVRGYCYVNPGNADVMDMLRRGYDEYGMSGVKLWVSHYCDAPEVFPVIEFCIEKDWPVLIHSFHKAVGQLPNETKGPNVAALAKRYPQAKLIMAHLGANCYHGIRAVQAYPNVMVDCSGTIFRRDDIDYTVEMLGARRVMLGTDLPQPGCFLTNYGQILEASLTPEERDLIVYKNAVRIFDGVEE